MLKSVMLAMSFAAATLVATVAPAQAPQLDPAKVCPAGTRYATIRHSMVKPGQWALFEQAVAAHAAWYTAHGNNTITKLVRVLKMTPAGPALATDQAVTITTYGDKPQPAHDAGYEAFTAKYRDSSEIKDEARVCMP